MKMKNVFFLTPMSLGEEKKKISISSLFLTPEDFLRSWNFPSGFQSHSGTVLYLQLLKSHLPFCLGWRTWYVPWWNTAFPLPAGAWGHSVPLPALEPCMEIQYLEMGVCASCLGDPFLHGGKGKLRLREWEILAFYSTEACGKLWLINEYFQHKWKSVFSQVLYPEKLSLRI